MIDLPTLLFSPTPYCSGVIVPGGFGSRGIEGMIATAKWAREKKIPFLGVCLGLQVAVIGEAGILRVHESNYEY